MVNLDKLTFLVVKDAVNSGSSLDYGDIESGTGLARERFKELDNRYNNENECVIDDNDLPLVLKALEWMLVINNNSDVLQIDKKQGLKLIELLKNKQTEISNEDWS